MNWVVLTTAPSLPIAEMWRDVLAEEGIPALIRPGDAMTSYLGVTSYPCRIMVNADTFDRALQILDVGQDPPPDARSDGAG